MWLLKHIENYVTDYIVNRNVKYETFFEHLLFEVIGLCVPEQNESFNPHADYILPARAEGIDKKIDDIHEKIYELM